jgi:heme-degrading monooxygenase HmoA
MYMRLVQAKYKPDSMAKLRQVYDESIIPRLQTIPGCLCACLIKREVIRNEGISLTLWDSKEHAEEYERSGVFQELLRQAKPYLSDSSEWKIQLSKNLKLEYKPVPEEPVVTSYPTLAQAQGKIPDHEKTSLMYLRILSIKVKPGKMEEFRKIYIEEILPTLYDVKGCRYAFLTENIEEEHEAISVTIWDSKEDADEYESNMIFDTLKKRVEHTFADVYQWRAVLEMEYGSRVVTSEDPAVKTYNVVTGRSFQ